MTGTIEITGTGGIIEGNLGAANVNVNLDASVRLSSSNDNGNYIGIPSNADIEALDDASGGTLSIWAKFNSAGEAGNYANLIGLGMAGASGLKIGIFRYKDSGNVFWNVVHADGSHSFFGNESENLNSWEHYAVTFKDSEFKAYKNGVLVATDTTAGLMSPINTSTVNGDSLCGIIGAEPADIDDNYDGELADARIYDGVLSADDIAILASKIRVDNSLLAGSSNLLLQYKLDGNDISSTTVDNAEGTSARDGIIKEHDGTASTHTLVRDAYSVDVYDNSTTTDGTFTVTQGKVEGKALSCLTLDGNGDHVDLASSFTMSHDGSSVAVWVKKDNATGNEDVIIGQASDANQHWLKIDTNGDIIFRDYPNDLHCDTAITDTNWHHIVVTLSGDSNGAIYVDGVAQTLSANGIVGDPTFDVIGIRGTIDEFDGRLRDLKVFDYALSAEQAASLYSNTYPQTAKHEWKMDEGTGNSFTGGGTTAIASSSFGGNAALGDNNGTLDLDSPLVISTNGTMSAPRGVLDCHASFTDNGSFTHNSGEVIMRGAGQDIDGSSTTTFFNLTSENFIDVTKSINVENLLKTTGSNSWRFGANSTITMGTATAQGTIQTGTSGSKGLRFSTASKTIKFAAANSLYPWIGIDGGSQWNIQAANVKVQLENCDMQFDFNTDPQAAGNNGEYELTGDCEFDAFTVSSGDTFDLNGQRAVFGGLLTISGDNGLKDTAGGAFLYTNGITYSSGTQSSTLSNTTYVAQDGANSHKVQAFIFDKVVTTRNGNIDFARYGPYNTGTDVIVANTGNLSNWGRNGSVSNNNILNSLTIATNATAVPESATLTLSGDFTTSGGLIGKSALHLNGSDQIVTVSDSSSMDAIATNDELTVEAWVNADDLSSSIADKSAIGRNSQFNINFESSNDKIEWLVYIGGSFQTLSSNTLYTSLTAGKYIHVAGTWDGTTMKLYIDGKLDAQSTPSGSMSDVSTDILIGGYRAGNEKHWDGIISKCSVWSKALTEAQIRTQMFYDYTAINADDTNFNDTLMGNLVGWWQFDEGTGTSTLDSTSNDNDGTLSSAAWAGAGTIGYTGDNTGFTLVMAKSGTQTINIIGGGFVDNLTINDGSTTEVFTINDAGSTINVAGNLIVNEKIKSHASSASNKITLWNAHTITIGSDVKTTALADMHQIKINNPSGTMSIPECTMKTCVIARSGGTTQATGDLTFTSELEVKDGTTFNANGNTINCYILDMKTGGTIDLRNSTLKATASAGRTFQLLDSTLLSGNSIIQGFDSTKPVDLFCTKDGNHELVGTLQDCEVQDDGDITVVGSVIRCTFDESRSNIRQWHHTLDTQQLLDADEAGDDDLRLTKPALDNALELMTK